MKKKRLLRVILCVASVLFALLCSAPAYADDIGLQPTEDVAGEEAIPDESTGDVPASEPGPDLREEIMVVKETRYLKTPDIWRSDNKKIAAVTSKGKVTGKRIGETLIRRYGESAEVYKVSVVSARDLPGKTPGYVSGNSLVLKKGKSLSIEAATFWTSSDPRVVKVTGKKTGRVKALRKGTAVIRAKGGCNREYRIKVEAPTIAKKDTLLKITVGGEEDVSERISGTSLPITFQSASPAIVSVDPYGRVKGKRAGKTKLYAIVNRRKYPMTVRCISNTVSGGRINASEICLRPGQSYRLRAILPKKSKGKLSCIITGGNITYDKKGKVASYSDGVISVTPGGRIKALSGGDSVVSATIVATIVAGGATTDGSPGGTTVRVHVEQPPKFPKSISLNRGDYYLIDTAGMKQDVVWRSSKPGIARVNEFGVIEGVSAGKAVISAKIYGKTYKIKTFVKLKDAPHYYDADYGIKHETIERSTDENPDVYRLLDRTGQYVLHRVYRIGYDLRGGSAGNPDIYMTHESVSLNAPVKEHYCFKGWTGSCGETPVKNVVIEAGSEGHRSYVANYDPVNYEITYDKGADDATLSGAPDSYNIESDDMTIPAPERDGYEFLGWTAGGSGQRGTKAAKEFVIKKGSFGDLYLHASWKAREDVPYRVERYLMDVDGMGYTPDESTEYKGCADSEVTLTPPDIEGFITPDPVTVKISPKGDTVIRYEYERKQYEIDVKNGDGSGIYYYGSHVNLYADPKPADYVDEEWLGQMEEVPGNERYRIKHTYKYKNGEKISIEVKEPFSIDMGYTQETEVCDRQRYEEGVKEVWDYVSSTDDSTYTNKTTVNGALRIAGSYLSPGWTGSVYKDGSAWYYKNGRTISYVKRDSTKSYVHSSVTYMNPETGEKIVKDVYSHRVNDEEYSDYSVKNNAGSQNGATVSKFVIPLHYIKEVSPAGWQDI